MEARWHKEAASKAKSPTWRAKGGQEAKPSKFAERYATFGARASDHQKGVRSVCPGGRWGCILIWSIDGAAVASVPIDS